ncbi:MAG: 50S ribosomal protein L10 [Pseudomonadota bacterium]
MQRSEKERVVAELADRLRASETLIVADYRGLTMPQIDELRSKLIEAGARFHVVKNTLTRRAAEQAGAESLLALLEGPSAIAFIESGGDPVAVAKALGETARTTQVLAVRGGMLEGKPISAEQVEDLAKLPPMDVLRAQVMGAIVAPLQTVVGLFNAPLRDLVGLIDARIEQLKEQGDVSGDEAAAAATPAATEPEAPASQDEAPAEEPTAAATADEAAAGEDTTTDTDTQEKEE